MRHTTHTAVALGYLGLGYVRYLPIKELPVSSAEGCSSSLSLEMAGRFPFCSLWLLQGIFHGIVSEGFCRGSEWDSCIYVFHWGVVSEQLCGA